MKIIQLCHDPIHQLIIGGYRVINSIIIEHK